MLVLCSQNIILLRRYATQNAILQAQNNDRIEVNVDSDFEFSAVLAGNCGWNFTTLPIKLIKYQKSCSSTICSKYTL